MRTTLDIDEDVLRAAKDIARAENRTAGAVISDLLRRSLQRSPRRLDVSKLPVRNGFISLPSRGGVVTSEMVERLMEECDQDDAGLLHGE
jgi:hypothetical protein